MNAIITTVLGVFATLGGTAGVVSVLTVRGQRRKIQSETKSLDADAATKISAASTALLAPFQASLEHITKQLAAAQNEVTALRTQVGVMTRDLETAHARIRELEGA